MAGQALAFKVRFQIEHNVRRLERIGVRIRMMIHDCRLSDLQTEPANRDRQTAVNRHAHARSAFSYCSGLNPTSRLRPSSNTGRLIIAGWATIRPIAFASFRSARSASDNFLNVVPERFSSV